MVVKNDSGHDEIDLIKSIVDKYHRDPPPRYEWVTYRGDDQGERIEGERKPLSVRIRSNLTFREIDDIPYRDGVQYRDIWKAIAPHCVEWNVTALNDETGEVEPVPPPAEVGSEILQLLNKDEMVWLVARLKYGHIQRLETETEKKDSPTSKPTVTPLPVNRQERRASRSRQSRRA